MPTFIEFKDSRDQPKKNVESMVTILHANNSLQKSEANISGWSVASQDIENTLNDGKQNLVVVNNEDEQDYCLQAVLISGTLLIVSMISLYFVILFIDLMNNFGFHFGSNRF